MYFNKGKFLFGIVMSIIIITAQIPAYSITIRADASKSSENTSIHNFVPEVMKTEKIVPTNQSKFETAATEEQRVLIDNLDDATLKPISVSINDIDSYEISSKGDVEAIYTLNGVQKVGRYLEKDIVRNLYTSDLEKELLYRPADVVADLLGLNQLQLAIADKTEEIIVAVIDTGVDVNHSLLKNRLVQGYDVIDDDLTVVDDNGHGTHVAGIIALSTPKNVKIMPIDVFGKEGALDSSIVSGIYYAVENGAKVINLSLGGYGMNSYLQKGIQYARNNGVMIVAASGNEAHDVKHDYPAAFKEVITVGATNNSGNLLYYSNFGEAIDICAPGEKIVSAYLDEGTESLSGTSMAAPFVSATAAMLWLDHKDMNLTQIEALLLANTKDLGAKGKDIAFGYGEINYENYESDENFYLIGYSDETEIMSFKYDMLLNYFAGANVKTVAFIVDDQLIYSSTSVNGLYSPLIDIRKLSVGQHLLKINIIMKDGSQKQVFKRLFTVPKYNVRLKLYNFYEKNITQRSSTQDLTSSLTFNAQVGTYVKSEDFIFEDGTLNKNIDFTKEATKKLYQYLITDRYDDELPIYLRGIFTSGDYLVEPTESQSTVFELSTDLDLSDSCTLDLPITWYRYGDKSIVRWDTFDYSPAGYAGLYQENQDMIDNNRYVIYHDQADFIVNITEHETDYTNKKISTACIYNDYLSHLQNDRHIAVSDLGYFLVENDENVIESNLELVNFGNKNTQTFYSTNFDYEGIMPSTAFFLSVLNRYDFQNGSKLNYHYKTSLDFSNNQSYKIKLGSKLNDVVWSNVLGDKYFYHSWADELDSSVFMSVSESNGNLYFLIPRLILTNMKTKSKVEVIGTQGGLFGQGFYKSTSAHMYNMEKVPNGVYEVTFDLENKYKKLPIESSYSVIEVKNGSVITQSNTAPKTIGEAYVSIMPHEKLELDLSQLFWDSEQNMFNYSCDDGVIIDNTYYYQDLLTKDKVVNIIALDGLGGVTYCKLTIRIGDYFDLTNDFEPVHEVIVMGASSWAKASISQAIKDGLVDNDLLENYQTEITREEFCELIVNVIEAKRGKIAILKGFNFKDTSNESILKAASLGIISSNSSGEINPTGQLSRQEFCTMLLKAAQKLNNQTFNLYAKIKPFSDWNLISSWAVQGTTFCVNNGFLSDLSGKIEPKKAVTREDAITMVLKLWNGYNNKTLK